MEIKLRMNVQLDYTVEIDPTDYENGEEMFKELTNRFEEMPGVKMASIDNNVTYKACQRIPRELEDAIYYLGEIRNFDLTEKQEQLIRDLNAYLEGIEDSAISWEIHDFVEEGKECKTIKEIEKGEAFATILDILEKIFFNEKGTESEWKALSKAWNEFVEIRRQAK